MFGFDEIQHVFEGPISVAQGVLWFHLHILFIFFTFGSCTFFCRPSVWSSFPSGTVLCLTSLMNSTEPIVLQLIIFARQVNPLVMTGLNRCVEIHHAPPKSNANHSHSHVSLTAHCWPQQFDLQHFVDPIGCPKLHNVFQARRFFLPVDL